MSDLIKGFQTIDENGVPKIKKIDYNALENKPEIPTKTSELTNDSGYVSQNSSKVQFSGDVIVGNIVQGESFHAYNEIAFINHENKNYTALTIDDTGNNLELYVNTNIDGDDTIDQTNKYTIATQEYVDQTMQQYNVCPFYVHDNTAPSNKNLLWIRPSYGLYYYDNSDQSWKPVPVAYT